MTNDTTTRDDAHTLLRQLSGDDTTFRPDQWEAIDGLVNRTEQLLLVQRTGWGKSAVYFIATRILRERGAGPTLLVSPLLALMRDQVRAAARLGLKAATINSSNTDDWDKIFTDLSMGQVDLLLISPERLNNPAFREKALDRFLTKIGLIVVDEAHCVSDWGHDFRPDYRRIQPVINSLAATVPVLLTTATANDRVIEDIKDQLGERLEVRRGTLVRDSLSLDVLDLPTSVERLAWLADQIPTFEGSGIVYCLTQGAVASVTEWLQTQGISAVGYTGGTPNDERLVIEQQLLANEVKAVVATSALGMGFDKPDLAWVVHYQSPGSPIAYYQQVGRAGRQLETSVGVLMRGSEDSDIQDFFIGTAYPTNLQASMILDAISSQDMSVPQVAALTNMRQTRIATFLKVLEVEDAVVRNGSRWFRTTTPWEYPAERVANVTHARKNEQLSMEKYSNSEDCYMQFLTDLLNDSSSDPCGRCANCTESDWPEPSIELMTAAEDFLGRQSVRLEPRKRWPNGLNKERPITPLQHHLLEPGYALCKLLSPVWAPTIRSGIKAGTYDGQLAKAMEELARAEFAGCNIRWATFVPSAFQPALIEGLAQAIASQLRLPLLDLLEKTPNKSPDEMNTAFTQASNALDGYRLKDAPPDTPGLLITDLVESRWSLTVAGFHLRKAGAQKVYPLVLADASNF